MNGKFLLKQTAKWRVLYVAALLASLSFFGVNALDTYEPTVVSDKEDYQPGDTAVITGYGWTKDDYVDVHLEEDPAHEHHHSYHDTKVNADGSWQIKYPIEDRHLGVKFTVIVEGKQSGAEARTYFTDAITWVLTFTTDPSTIAVGEETEFNFKATVTGATSGDRVSCIRIVIPSGFDYVENSISDNNNNWASVVNTTSGAKIIQVNANGNGDRLNSQGSIEFKLKVKAKTEIAGSTVFWTASAGTTTNCSNTTVAPDNGQPRVSVGKASQSMTFAEISNKRYGDAPFTLVASSSSGLPVHFTVEGPATLGANNLLTIIGVGTVTVKANQVGNDNYNAAPEVVRSFKVAKASATIALDNLSHIYDGVAKSASAATNPANLSGLTLSYKPEDAEESQYTTVAPLNAGVYNVRAVLDNPNYDAAVVTELLTINKANQVITWNAPAEITYGTALSAEHLNAVVSSGDGMLSYSPAAGTVLNAGEGQALTVSAAATNNYNAAQASVKINVLKATPTVSLTVGGPYTYDGTAKSVSGATVTGVGGASLGTATVIYKQGETTVAAPTNAGTYAVHASFDGNENYKPAQANGTLVINKAEANLTAYNLEGKVYNGASHAVSVTTDPADLSGITIKYFQGTTEVPASTVINAGNYTYTASLENSNFTAEPISGSFTIGTATLTIKADDASRVYGENNAQFTGSVISGAVEGEKFVVTASSGADAASIVGKYDIIPSVSGATLTNYNVVADKGILTITPRPITIATNAGQTKVYGEDDPAAYTYQVSSGSLVEASHLRGSLTRATGESVGDYAITQGTLATSDNYTLTFIGADFSITQRAVMVTADQASKVYGESDPELTYKVSAGSVVSGDAFTGSLKRAVGEDVATYAVTLGTLSLGDNYNLSLVQGTVFTITPKAITVTPVAGQNKVYGTADPAFSYTSTALVGSDAFSGALSRDPGNNVGPYSITQGSLALSSNYTLEFVEGVKFHISPKTLVASISAEDKVYDGNRNATASGSVPASDVVGNDNVVVTVTNALFDNKIADTGKTVTADVAISNGNYTLSNSSVSTTANISPKPITGAFAANDKVYDGTTAATVAIMSLVGVIEGDEVALNGGEATFADKNANTGKTVTLTGAELTGADKDNYSLTQVATALAAISPKPASVTAMANSKVYGTAEPVLTGSVEGFIGTDGIAATFTRAAGEAVGNYLIIATLSPTDALSNYSINYNTAEFEITKAALAVSADDKSKIYGDANPTFTGSVTGVVAGDVITADYNSVATAASPVGTYAITPSLSGDALKNYEVTATNGTLTITKAPLNVVANDKSRIYGVVNPELDGEVTGVKNNDRISASYTTDATIESNVGIYPITVALNDPDNKLGNYAVSTTNSKLTITQAPATISIAGLSKVYNGKGQGAEVTPSPEGLAVIVTYTGKTDLPIAAGSYDVVAALNNSNYAAENATGTLVIAPKTLTAALAHPGKVYDGTTAAPGTTATLEGVIGEDDVTSGVTNAAFNSAAAGERTVSGTVSLSGNDKDNYVLGNVINANATIAPKAVTAGITATDKVYDGNTAASATGSVSAADVVDGDKVEVTVSNANFANKHVGTSKVVTATVSISNGNYSLSSTTATTTASITAKGLTASVSASDKVYDGSRTAAVVASLTDGLVSGDDVAVSALEGLFDTKNVGVDKPVTATISISGKDAQNYQVNTSASTTASITAKPVSVVADAKSKTYGDQDPALTYSAAPGSLIEGDSFTGVLSRVAGENIGAYAIEQNTLSAGSNYALTFVPANLTISQRAIEVTADAKQKMAGQLDPALTYKVTSGALVLGDAFSGALERDGGEAPGEYAINQGSLSAGNNYSLTYKGAKLTIHAIPTVALENPAPVQYSTAVTVSASYTGIVTNPVWVWGFTANTNGVQSATNITGSTTAPSTPGVYTLVLKYRNAVGDELTTAPVFLSVYDPEGGFVTGGGWINSPAGALDGSDVTGKANFGFVAKYKKGKNEVEGNTEFQFQAGNINFKSSAHNAGSLVISGAKATYKGIGTIAGLTGTYEFMVVATDGQVTGGGGNDKFRIKIWNGGNVIYDNARGQLENAELGENTILGGGSIVIHEVKAVTAGPKTSKVVSQELAAESTARFDNYPNAFSDRTTIRFSFDTEQSFELEVYDIRGALVKKVAAGVAEAGQVYEYELDGHNLAEGVYFGRLATGAGVKTIKMLLKK